MNTPEKNIIPEGLDNEISIRIKKIRRHAENAGVDAILVASNANIIYTTGRFFRGYVLIFTDDQTSPLYLVIRPDGYEGDNIEYIRKPELIPDIIGKRGLPIPGHIALEFDSLSYSEISRLSKVFPNAEISNANPILRKARMVKTEYEINEMRKDALHQAEVYRRIPKCWKEDMTDVELQVEIERVLRLEGALGFTRTNGPLMEINSGSLLAGENADNPAPYEFAMGGAGTSPALPGGANGSIIKPGQTIMVDMSGAFNDYQSDMTRVWKVGDIPQIAYKAHDCSREILRHIENIARPGIPVAKLYEDALKIVEDHRLKDYFMGHRQKVNFIGHGVGIELNEMPVITPRSKDILEENMTLAIEPKFVIPHVGAVGVENTYVVRNDRLEPLTIFPEEIQEI